MKTLKMLALIILVSWILTPLALANESAIINAARRASVQTVFRVPVLKVWFTNPLPEDEPLDREVVEKMLAEKEKETIKTLENLLEKEKGKLMEEFTGEKHETSLTTLEKWGYEPPARTFIPLGAIAPKGVKFPKRVLITTKIEETDLTKKYWEKEYEEDVLAIAETLETSPSKAKQLLSSLSIKGYTVSKEEVMKAEEITLFYYSTWDTTWPTKLDWKVYVHGKEENMIIGYHADIGVLETKPIPEGSKVYVKSSYYDLKDKFKQKDPEIARLEAEIERLKESRETLAEAFQKMVREKAKLEEKDVPKRDIANVTWLDVRTGYVSVEWYRFTTAASGVFLGNMKVRDEFYAYNAWRHWWNYEHDVKMEHMGVILTNAHVACIIRD